MTRFPLYAKILGWFFLNLLALAAGFWLLVRPEVRLNTLVAGAAGDRMQRVASLALTQLHDQPESAWNEALARFSEAYGVTFFLADDGGHRLAGPPNEFPADLLRQLPHRGSPGAERPPPPDRPGASPPGSPGPRDDRGPPWLRPAGAPGPRHLVHTRNPDYYWFVVPAQMPRADLPHPVPVRLLVRSSTLAAGGLFYDTAPWLWAGAGVLTFSVLWWLPFVGRITRTLRQTTDATQAIADGRFDVRVPELRHDELGTLNRSVNRMASRLDDLVTGQRRFLGDIAHELCAPLSRIQLALGILDQRADDRGRPYVEDLREEIQHMSALVNELLTFSKAALGGPAIQRVAVRLREVAECAILREKAGPVAITVDIDPDLTAWAEPELLTRALANLVRNAVRHAGEAGPLTVSARREADTVRLSVADSGPGVPEESLARIFDPFYRLDESRARETGGVGLGLAIVKTCVAACQGTVTARNLTPRGLEVTIRLPAVAAPTT